MDCLSSSGSDLDISWYRDLSHNLGLTDIKDTHHNRRAFTNLEEVKGSNDNSSYSKGLNCSSLNEDAETRATDNLTLLSLKSRRTTSSYDNTNQEVNMVLHALDDEFIELQIDGKEDNQDAYSKELDKEREE